MPSRRRRKSPDLVRKCEGYTHYFVPTGNINERVCQCKVFRVSFVDGHPDKIEPVPELNPDKKVAKSSEGYREV